MFLAMLLAAVVLATVVATPAQSALAAEGIEISGTFTETLGAANGRNYDITNKTGEDICDFTITIEEKTPGDPPATITDVEGGTLDFNVDDNLDGDINDTGENNNNDSSPGTTTRTEAKVVPAGTNCIPNNNAETFNLDIRLSGITNGNWTITIQPTDRKGLAIGKGLGGTAFSGQESYGVTLTTEAALIAPYTGLTFNDINATGAALTTLYLAGQEFFITDVFQTDAAGQTILGSTYSSSTRLLQLGAPVTDGDPFFLGVEVATFVGGPMTVLVSTTPIGGTTELLVGDSDASSENAGSTGDSTLPIAVAAGGLLIALAGGGLFMRRRLAH